MVADRRHGNKNESRGGAAGSDVALEVPAGIEPLAFGLAAPVSADRAVLAVGVLGALVVCLGPRSDAP